VVSKRRQGMTLTRPTGTDSGVRNGRTVGLITHGEAQFCPSAPSPEAVQATTTKMLYKRWRTEGQQARFGGYPLCEPVWLGRCTVNDDLALVAATEQAL